VILVAGESLIDLIVEPEGSVRASPGGGPFNAARTIARLGHPTRFLGRFSTDPFGRLLTGRLAGDGVHIALPDPVEAPTALAVVAVDALGVPRYWFHLAGTAGFMLDRRTARRAIESSLTALHIGTLGLVADPMATELEHTAASLPRSVLLLLDPNCRPGAIPDAGAYRARIHRILPRADIVKVSTEDLAFLVPETGVPEAARSLLGTGAGVVLVTDGPALIRAYSGEGDIAVAVPPVEVVDTVGAGDAFGGAFLAWWAERGLAREDLADPARLRAAVMAAAQVSSLTCCRAGADPPWRHELAASDGWGAPPSGQAT
jgi:fructokinase